MRYVRPPVDQRSDPGDVGPLFPLRPNTRKLRVAVDADHRSAHPRVVASPFTMKKSIPSSGAERRTETYRVDSDAGNSRWYRFTFTTVAEAPKFADSSTVGISATRMTRERWRPGGTSSASTRSLTMQHVLRTRRMPRSCSPIATGLRPLLRGRAIGADVVVTVSPTAGRHDVGDNDLVVSVTPASWFLCSVITFVRQAIPCWPALKDYWWVEAPSFRATKQPRSRTSTWRHQRVGSAPDGHPTDGNRRG